MRLKRNNGGLKMKYYDNPFDNMKQKRQQRKEKERLFIQALTPISEATFSIRQKSKQLDIAVQKMDMELVSVLTREIEQLIKQVKKGRVILKNYLEHEKA